MKAPNVSRAIKLCGTEQPDVVGQILTAGPLTAELDNGNLRYLKVGGVEVLRALSYLVRDENWGTYIPDAERPEDRAARRLLLGELLGHLQARRHGDRL